MKKLLASAVLALGLIAAPVMAETAAAPAPAVKAANPQQEKMKACAAEYHQKGIVKSEHRKFMSTCLKKDYVPGSYNTGGAAAAAPAAAPEAAAPAAPVNQKDKMKSCNKDAKEKALKGQERKDFMKSCLSAAH